MLTEIVATIFRKLGHTWVLDNDKVIVPDSQDIERFFDEAVKHLWTEPVGTRLTSGSMIIEKAPEDHYDVYVYVGNYK